LKIPKGGNQNPQIEEDHTMAKKEQHDNDLQNITDKTKT
jgi:hypothetical protein